MPARICHHAYVLLPLSEILRDFTSTSLYCRLCGKILHGSKPPAITCADIEEMREQFRRWERESYEHDQAIWAAIETHIKKLEMRRDFAKKFSWITWRE